MGCLTVLNVRIAVTTMMLISAHRPSRVMTSSDHRGRTGMSTSVRDPLIQFIGVSKRFPGVLAVDDVNLDIYPGEVHVVAGENGAGKSTLMKLLSQVERPSSGTISLNGQEVHFVNPQHAQALGIAMVYQEFALAPHLTVAENIALGREPARMGVINKRAEITHARE